MNRFAAIPLGAVVACLLAFAIPAHAQQQPQAQASQEERIQRLEEHLLDLNSMIATLQSLVSQGGAAAAAPGGMVPPQAPAPQFGSGGGDAGQRLDVMETQIRALTGQIEQMSQQIAQLQASLGGGGQMAPQNAPATGFQQNGAQQGFQQQGQDRAFGQTMVQPGQQGAGQQQDYGAAANPWQQNNAGVQQQQQHAALAPNADTRAAYEAAYNHLLQRDFAAAEQGFRSFLQTYPNDPLAGNAQYWLGETYYVRGQFREAADSFLAGYRKYRDGDKAPANLLKLGMALNQLGEQDAACSTFAELADKFPNAPAHLKQRADSERQRSGC